MAKSKAKSTSLNNIPLPNKDSYTSSLSKTLSFLSKEVKDATLEKELKKYIQTTFNKKPPGLPNLINGNLTITLSKLSFIKNRNGYLSDVHEKQLNQSIQCLMNHTNKKQQKNQDSKPTNKPSIQDYIKNQAAHAASEFDYAIDCYLKDDKPLPDALEVLREHELKGPHMKYITSFYENAFNELQEINSNKEVKEAYQHLTKKQLDDLVAFYEQIFLATNVIQDQSKQNRKPKKTKKNVNATTKTKNLKYCKEDRELYLSSINPSKIIGANEVWIYNTKTREFGVYTALDVLGIDVKGTTLKNIMHQKCRCKKVKKPQEFFKRFKSNRFTKRKMKNAFESLITKEKTMNTRLNNNIVILAVF